MARSNILPAHTAILRRMRLFQNLPEPLTEELIAHLRVVLVKRGEQLFSAGDKAERFYGVLDGWVKVFKRTAEGNEAVLGLFTQSETFAEAAMFMDERYPASAEVVVDSELCCFEKCDFEQFFLTDPVFCKGVLAALSGHLMRMTRELEQLQVRKGDERLARFLLSFCPDTRNSYRVKLPYDKSLIAHRLGMKPETLSRTFAKLRSLGVEVNNDIVAVSNPAELMNRFRITTRS